MAQEQHLLLLCKPAAPSQTTLPRKGCTAHYFASALRQTALLAMPHLVFSGIWLPSASATAWGAQLLKGHQSKIRISSFLRAEQKERKKEGKKNPAETSKDDVKSQGEGATKGRNTAPSPAAVKMWGGFSSPLSSAVNWKIQKHSFL